MRHHLRLTCLLLAAFVVSPVFGHDFWIEPSDFSPDAPASVNVSLRVGEGFSGRDVRRQVTSIARFEVAGPSGVAAVPGLEDRTPAGFLRIDAAGDYRIGYETLGQRIELAADRFESYLAHEGLEHIVAKRHEQGASARPGRERFFRCAKSLVRAGTAAEPLRDDPLGLTLELVLEADPRRIAATDNLPLRVLFRGEPLADLLVVGLRKGAVDSPFQARTDAEGRVMVPLAAGEWLLKAVHMVPAAEADADWASYWASLTFVVPPAEAASD